MDRSTALTPRQKQKRPSGRWALIVLVLCLVLMVGAIALPSLNNVNRSWVECEVTNAYAQRGDNHSAQAWTVSLETADCGVLSYGAGVNRDNVDEIADSFEPGEYKFMMGLVSKLAAAGYIPNTNASVEDYRPSQ